MLQPKDRYVVIIVGETQRELVSYYESVEEALFDTIGFLVFREEWDDLVITVIEV